MQTNGKQDESEHKGKYRATAIRLLVVEDNPGDARLIKVFLSDVKSVTINIQNAERLSDALVFLEEQAIDAVLLDLSLPDSQGLDTLARLSHQAGEVPILVLTGLDDEATGLLAIQQGAQDYLVKGHIDGPLLERTIRYAIERKEIEHERRDKEAAEKANLAKTEFLSRMSHELRTPLNSILGFAQLLEMEQLTPDQHENVDYILSAGKHLLNLIGDVLDISRIESGQFSISIEPVELVDLLRECIRMLRTMAGTHHVHLQCDEERVQGSYLLADRHRLKQVVLNLLSNAIKYNRPGGSVTIGCGPGVGPAKDGGGDTSAAGPAQTLRVSVVDTGWGIPADKLHRLFTPFERLGIERSGVEGTGLGLALSKHLIHTMGGTIGVDSKPGTGSTFWLELPQVVEQARQADDSITGPLKWIQAGKPHNLLYIEDNLSNIKLIERVLARVPNIQLMSAMQGGLGLDLARLHMPDLILLDLHLPDMSGKEVLIKLREDPATMGIPVIMLSAEQSRDHIDLPPELDIRAYISKPLDIKQFLQALRDVLEE